MSSSWGRQANAVFRKEFRSELRSRHGLFTSGLFGFLTVIAMVFAAYAQKPTPPVAAGMLCVALVFSAVVTLPRTMIVEDEQGTFALLQLLADPSAAFFGKAMANCVQMALASFVLGGVFVGMVELPVARPFAFCLGLLLLALALAGGTSFCAALVIGAANRWVLAGVVALPLLVPVVFLGVVALQSGLGAGTAESGTESLVALGGYTMATLAAGPSLVAAVWRSD
jgi:heme exporter protein B